MVRGLGASRAASPFALVVVACCSAAFSLGLLSPPTPSGATAKPSTHPEKTAVRALSGGMDVGVDLDEGAWVGLSEPSLGKTAFRGGASGAPAGNPTDTRVAEFSRRPARY